MGLSPKIDITTTLKWTDLERIRSITVVVNPFGDADITYKVGGTEDQVLNLDEPAWHALYAMLGEIRSG